jgi:foldase protein PrsA
MYPALLVRAPRQPIVVIVAVAAAAWVAGCGSGVPAGDVAKVGDSLISKQELDHWMRVVVASQRQQTGAKGPARVPKPGTRSYESVRDQALQFLISSRWIRGQAKEMGITASQSEIRRQFEETKDQSFKTEKQYERFLASSEMTQEDINTRVEQDLLQQKIRQKVSGGEVKPSSEDVKTYYDQNKARFTQPERRDLRIVLNKSRAKVEQAKSALESGESWKQVARKYSTDPASKGSSGKLPGVSKGQQEPALDKAVFASKRGELVGPIKTQFGYYLFTIEKIHPEQTQSLEKARESIQSIVAAQQQQQKLDSFVQDFQSKWKERTRCADGFVISDCENAPNEVPKTPGQAPVVSSRPVAPGSTLQSQGLPQGPHPPPSNTRVVQGGLPGGVPGSQGP